MRSPSLFAPSAPPQVVVEPWKMTVPSLSAAAASSLSAGDIVAVCAALMLAHSAVAASAVTAATSARVRFPRMLTSLVAGALFFCGAPASKSVCLFRHRLGLGAFAIAQDVADIVPLVLEAAGVALEVDILLRAIADDAERVFAGGHGGKRFAHHLAHLDDAAIRYGEMLVRAIGDHALLLDRHAVLI